MRGIRFSILHYLLLLIGCIVSLCAQGQSHYHSYIREYHELAVEQMKKYGIPASITLAQGLLESGAGQSVLARKANNHFGIKVSGSWDGPYVKHDDDARNEKFRKYRSAKQSYEDHSLFLKNGSRYAFLFRLDKDDYKGWAKGLKRAGYATNPKYAQLLIDLIERYELYRFDAKLSDSEYAIINSGYRIYRCNDSYYVLAKEGDTFKSLSKALDVGKRKLRKYNELERNHVFKAGEVVFLTKKQRKADKSFKGAYHVVDAGESIHSISQRYAVRVSTLYKINRLPDDYSPKVGDRLLIRK